ncbi:hypothetical protein FJZ31_03340 [Candidatus Poribacteria bacterium]|nr:hypothetical protein [Candidatus Poribacteria bacterium]
MRRFTFLTLAIFTFITLLGFSSMTSAQIDTWTRKADMPTPRRYFSTSVVNGKIYAIGGWDGDKYPSTVEEYDPATDTWTRKADMPTARGGCSTNVVNGKIYAIGGGNDNYPSFYLSTVEEYNPMTDSWTQKADMPTPREGPCASVVNGKIYVIGGWRAGFVCSTVEEYDPATDTWTKKADMPTPRATLCAAVNGKIYALGGYQFQGQWEASSTVEEYDPTTDTWTKGSDMPAPRLAFGISLVNGKIYVIGGYPDNSRVDEYDPATDIWIRKADLPTPRGDLSASTVNGYIYTIGGNSIWGALAGLSIVEEYDTGVGIRVAPVPPREGRVTGGEPIAIFGSRFPSDAIVTIGGKPLTELKVTDTLITGVTPPGPEGEQDVLITAPSLDFTVFAGTFIYLPLSNIVVTAITPTNGKQAGGDRGSITGSGFLSGAMVTIGGVPATDVIVTPTLIIFTIPPGTAAVKDVVITNPDGQKGTLRGGYTYNPFPVIEEIEPAYGGPLTGGTSITITGSNFMQGVFAMIGSERVSRLDFFSPTELRLKTPPGAVGKKDVRVVNPDGQEAVLKEGFIYNPAPTIASVTPNAGPLEGGTDIIITGTRFLSGADVFIGGAEVSANVASPTKIKAETPPSTAGLKDVVVQNRDGQEATLEDAFTYNPAPAITKVIPDNGRLAGGTKITIQGNGFLPGAKVLFGDVYAHALVVASAIQVMSPNLIIAVTPAGEPGRTDIVIRNPDRQEIVLPGGFTYNPLPTITSISPTNGPASGGTKVIITGTGFLLGARVIIGKRAATTELRDETTLEAVMPANPQGVFDVRVINPDTQEAVKTQGFTAVGELVYNFPNPFRAEQGTTFRYVTNEKVELIKVQIFNLAGVPIGVVGRSGSNEVRWYDPSVHAGLYVY